MMKLVERHCLKRIRSEKSSSLQRPSACPRMARISKGKLHIFFLGAPSCEGRLAPNGSRHPDRDGGLSLEDLGEPRSIWSIRSSRSIAGEGCCVLSGMRLRGAPRGTDKRLWEWWWRWRIHSTLRSHENYPHSCGDVRSRKISVSPTLQPLEVVFSPQVWLEPLWVAGTVVAYALTCSSRSHLRYS